MRDLPGKRCPIVSVVTPSFNQGEFLPATIESVLSQAGDFFLQYLIVDGGSTDDSVQVMKRYELLLQRDEWQVRCKGITFHWLSEQDEGQADAVNKGFARANGELLGWLNSDDTYLPGALAQVLESFDSHPEAAMVYGNAWYTGRDGAVTGSYRSEPFSLERLAQRSIICQPAAFLRAEALREVGALDTALHTCLDYDLWIRFGRRFEGRIHFLEQYLATSRMYAENKTQSLRDRVYRETMQVTRRHYGYVPGVWVIHSVLEIFQTPGLSLPEKLGMLARGRLFPLRYLLQPKTLLSVASFLLSRLTK
jgi:glycosyltransferase involved in cell wall biosynthesis